MLTGKVAWVTGATGGLGPAVVRALTIAGASIVATSRSADGLRSLQAEAGIADEGWLACPGDLTDDKVAKAVVAAALDHFGHLDILAAVAGGWRGGSTVTETAPLDLEWLLGINLLTAFNASQAVLPGMLAQRWGRIVTIGARAAVGGQARSGAYAASKAALLALTQSIAAEMRSGSITANTVMVSTIDTPANRAAMPESDHHHWVMPEQIAATVCFLCSEEAAAINGAAIPVYGRV